MFEAGAGYLEVIGIRQNIRGVLSRKWPSSRRIRDLTEIFFIHLTIKTPRHVVLHY